jgi:3',5'-cyclic AMP phosphodiesterase CpdA
MSEIFDDKHEGSATAGADKCKEPATDHDRRHFLECMAWSGIGVVWSVIGGVPRALAAGDLATAKPDAIIKAASNFTFAQISDSHIGFNKEANPDSPGTLLAGIEKIRALNIKPSFLIHTGDITHLSKAEQFDTADQIIGKAGLQVHYVPGEHDMVDADNGKLYLERYGKGTKGAGWYSFDDHGVHFVALVNVVNLKAGGLGQIGVDQMAWLRDDLSRLAASTPIVVFAHIPLWSVYPQWGWGTEESGEVLKLLKRFGSVTVLNGHIHQIMQKVEGNVTFHTARATGFPQPAPGTAPSPGPMKVPADQLNSYLGVTHVDMLLGQHRVAIVDSTLV